MLGRTRWVLLELSGRPYISKTALNLTAVQVLGPAAGAPSAGAGVRESSCRRFGPGLLRLVRPLRSVAQAPEGQDRSIGQRAREGWALAFDNVQCFTEARREPTCGTARAGARVLQVDTTSSRRAPASSPVNATGARAARLSDRFRSSNASSLWSKLRCP